MLTVTQPLLPPLEDFNKMLQEIWESKWITNNGQMHQRLEHELSQYLGVEHVSLFTNGTLPLITALQALRITGEVITTPYSFVATSHSLWWNGVKPVFVDVDPMTGNMDPKRIEAAITPRTTAIMPVHVYGNPCDTKAIGEIANIYGLKVIYDAAHAFGVKVDGKSVLEYGDMATLSFHATKVYNTIEGGALITRSPEMKQRVDYLKNFGFENETQVIAPGINSKMDEIRAAYGLLNLQIVPQAIQERKKVAQKYRLGLKDVPGIRMLEEQPTVEYNCAYFPIFVDEAAYGRSRDQLYFAMKEQGVCGRRYFYPLISDFSPYRSLPSAAEFNIPQARKMAAQVICLPIHHNLSEQDVDKVISLITE